MASEGRSIDKSTWGEGPWQQEPDRVEFEHAGYRCLLKRAANHGAWCGYVGVPEGHPWHGAGYGDVDASVHGGLSYAAPCDHEVGICHVPAPGEPESLHWLGFDCLHAGDMGPALMANEPRLNRMFAGEYRDLAYVRAECESLAEQARDATRDANRDARLTGRELGIR